MVDHANRRMNDLGGATRTHLEDNFDSINTVHGITNAELDPLPLINRNRRNVMNNVGNNIFREGIDYSVRYGRHGWCDTNADMPVSSHLFLQTFVAYSNSRFARGYHNRNTYIAYYHPIQHAVCFYIIPGRYMTPPPKCVCMYHKTMLTSTTYPVGTASIIYIKNDF